MANPLTNPDAEIADRINTALINKKVPVTTLSEKTGIADKTLRRSLSGGRSLTFRELEAIADALQVPPSILLPDSFSDDEGEMEELSSAPSTAELATTEEVAERFNVSRSTIYRRVKDGTLRVYKLGNRTIRFDVSEVAAAFRTAA